MIIGEPFLNLKNTYSEFIPAIDSAYSNFFNRKKKKLDSKAPKKKRRHFFNKSNSKDENASAGVDISISGVSNAEAGGDNGEKKSENIKDAADKTDAADGNTGKENVRKKPVVKDNSVDTSKDTSKDNATNTSGSDKDQGKADVKGDEKPTDDSANKDDKKEKSSKTGMIVGFCFLGFVAIVAVGAVYMSSNKDSAPPKRPELLVK